SSSSSWSEVWRPYSPISSARSASSVPSRSRRSIRCVSVTTSRTVAYPPISARSRCARARAVRAPWRSSVDSDWSARASRTTGSTRTRESPAQYTVTVVMDAETATVGTPACREVRSAARWRVPVSAAGCEGSGTRWTLARRIRVPSVDSTTAPSILLSSRRSAGPNSTSRSTPPAQMARTAGSCPSTISPPLPLRRMRSRASRRGVPGARRRRTSRIAAPAGEVSGVRPGWVADSVPLFRVGGGGRAGEVAEPGGLGDDAGLGLDDGARGERHGGRGGLRDGQVVGRGQGGRDVLDADALGGRRLGLLGRGDHRAVALERRGLAELHLLAVDLDPLDRDRLVEAVSVVGDGEADP